MSMLTTVQYIQYAVHMYSKHAVCKCAWGYLQMTPACNEESSIVLLWDASYWLLQSTDPLCVAVTAMVRRCLQTVRLIFRQFDSVR